MSADPLIDSYEWAGGCESMLRFGPADGPVVVLALPLFEEANRVRAFAAGICRTLAARGIGSTLADLPGQGESTVATEHATLPDLRDALAAVPGSHVVAIRSGGLLLDSRPCWLLAPQDGASLARELTRIKGGPLAGERVEIAGNLLSSRLIQALHDDVPPASSSRRGEARVVRLISDARPADRHIDGPALWRRAEPDDDPIFAQTLAADIVEWIATCDA